MSRSKNGRVPSRLLFFLVFSGAVVCTATSLGAAVGRLETPIPGSFQSGVGLIRGWVCGATQVIIEINGTILVPAVYGEERGDTQPTCGDTNNGFSLQVNWNELGEGAHTVRALADNEEVGRATAMVTTLGQTFFLGAQGEFPVQPFPQSGQTTRLRWQESRQQFVLSNGTVAANGGTSLRTDAKLEDPAPGSFQSGIGLIRGWVCSATRIEVFVDGRGPVPAVYQELRGDTQPVCGDSNNGFSIQANWNDLGDGPHTVRVLADGSEVGQATFTVVTLGLGSFPLGLEGSFILPNFPQSGFQTTVAWQESQQNFVITGARFPAIEEGLCKIEQGQAVDINNVQAAIAWSNPCLLSGNLAVLHVQVPRTTAALSSAAHLTVATAEREQRAASTANFFLCATSITIQQQSRTFSASDFRLVDLTGNEVCREIPVGTELDIVLQVNAESDLNFNAPFQVFYNNQSLVNFPSTALQAGQPILTLSTAQLNFGATSSSLTQLRSTRAINESMNNTRDSREQTAAFQDKTFTIRNEGNGALIGGLTLIASGSGGNVFRLLIDGTLNLNPGQSLEVPVRYSPVDNSSVTGSVRISTNAGAKSVLLQGAGIDGLPQPQPQLEVSPSSVNFRTVEVSKSRDESFTILNAGQGTLTGRISVAPPFSLLSSGTFSLASGQSLPVGVRFTPTASGSFTGTATVTSNGGTATVPLTGQGAPCTFTLSAVSAQVAAAGGIGSVGVSAAGGCRWAAVSNVPWITITGGSSGAGNGTVSYTVAANTSSNGRTGTLTIAEQTFTVTQGGRPLYSLTIEKTGTGSGTVTSSPGGISCGRDCTESYVEGTVVTLTAAVSADSIFAGWTGDCIGEGTSITVTMTANRSCTATFNSQSSLSERCRQLLVGAACGGSFACISLRIPSEASCQGACANNVASALRAEGITVSGPSGSLPSGIPPGCIGVRSDIGGTLEGAQCLLDFLGSSYRLEDPNNGRFCHTDGFPYNVILP